MRFWPLQLMGWGFDLLVNIVSSIPYRRSPDFHDYLAFRGAFLLSCFLASFPMYWLCHFVWQHRSKLRTLIAVCMGLAYPLGFLCAGAAFACAVHWNPHRRPVAWIDVFAATPSGWFVLVAWTSFYFGIKQYLALEEKHRELIATEMMAREAQLRALRYQLQPHFLFNTLNAVSTLVLNEEPLAATEMIGKLAHLLRSTLDAPDLHEITLADELAVTEEYLAIEEVRFGDRLTVRWDVDPAIIDTLVPRLILQPLVENAVRHGIACRPKGGFILVQTRRHGDHLDVCIENEPPEESVAVLMDGMTRTGGVGLENVRQRLEQMYGPSSSMHMMTNARGNFEVSLRLPLCFERQKSPDASYYRDEDYRTDRR